VWNGQTSIAESVAIVIFWFCVVFPSFVATFVGFLIGLTFSTHRCVTPA